MEMSQEPISKNEQNGTVALCYAVTSLMISHRFSVIDMMSQLLATSRGITIKYKGVNHVMGLRDTPKFKSPLHVIKAVFGRFEWFCGFTVLL